MTTPRRLRNAVAAAGLAGLASLGVAGPAAAAVKPAVSPAPGTNLLTNGTLTVPGTNAATPTGWTGVNLDNETKPYNAAIAQYNATGAYPPPSGTPNASGFASEAFYEGGNNTGSEGYGGQQTPATFGSITQADNPQISYSTVETAPPDKSVVAWAGTVFQVVATSGTQTYTLRYFDPFTAPTGEIYSGAPTSSGNVAYITGPTLTTGTWTTVPTRNLSADLSAAFHINTFTVTSVTYGDLEGTTSNGAGGDYPNETSYWTNLAVAEGSSPAPALPESPAVIELPLAAAALIGGGLVLRSKRRTTAATTD